LNHPCAAQAENDFAGIALGGWSLATTTDAPADEASVDVVGASLDLQYTAPEVLAACGDGGAPPPGAFATAQDVWALGVLLHVLLAGHPPLDQERLDEDAMRAAIPAYVFDDGAPWTANVSANGLAFLKRMLAVDPARRPGAGELLQDAYMRSAVPRATVLDTADLAKFAERRKTVWKSTTGLGRPDQALKCSSSIKSKSIRLLFGRIDCSRRVLEARSKNLAQFVQLRAH
jgi:serine/threonine protein kinase